MRFLYCLLTLVLFAEPSWFAWRAWGDPSGEWLSLSNYGPAALVFALSAAAWLYVRHAVRRKEDRDWFRAEYRRERV